MASQLYHLGKLRFEQVGLPGYPSEQVGLPGYPSEQVGLPGYPSEQVGLPGYPSEQVGLPGYPSKMMKKPQSSRSVDSNVLFPQGNIASYWVDRSWKR